MTSDRVAKVLAIAAKLPDEERAELAERLWRTVPDTLRASGSRRYAAATTTHVLGKSTRMALERNAEEYARDMLSDVAFRTKLHDAAIASARELAASLRASRV